MTRLLVALLLFILLINPVSAETVSIGIQPTEMKIYETQDRTIRFWNEGPTDAIYWVVVEDDIKEYVRCRFCEEEFIVPADGNRINDYLGKTISFISLPNSLIESGIYVYGKPANSEVDEGMVAIQPRLKINVAIGPRPTTTTTTTTLPTSSSGGSTWWNPLTWFVTTTTTTTTTTTKTTPRWTPNGEIRHPITSTTTTTTIPEQVEKDWMLLGTYALGIVILILISYYLYIKYK